MSRHRLKQINRLAKVISFFTLLGVNIYLSCSYLKSIPESEYVPGMFLGVFILQLFVSISFMVAQQRNSYNSSNYVGCNLFILFRIHMLHKQQSYSI